MSAGSALERYFIEGQLCPDDMAENSRRYDAGRRLGEAFKGWSAGTYRDWRSAVRAIGPISAPEVIDACCLGALVGDRLEILRRGLRELANYYGRH